jgi:hypothetical protein
LPATLLFFSCKKDEESCVAGSTGDLTLVIRLQHHEHTITNLKFYRDTIYIKFNSLEFQGMHPANYDAIYIGEFPGDSVIIPNLNCGKYYIFATGMEHIHQERVYGGIPFQTDQKSGRMDVWIPVTD